jgi:hypothetical protein
MISILDFSDQPTSNWEFFTHPAALLTFGIGGIFIFFAVLIIKNKKINEKAGYLLKIYWVFTLGPLYLAAGILYIITFSKLNLFKKFKEVEFVEKFKKTYTNPKELFEDMRVNPKKYHFWEGFLICAVFIFIDYLLIMLLSERIGGGSDTLILGTVNNNSPIIENPWARWPYKVFVNLLVWFPTKFFIMYAVRYFHKYDSEDEPSDRPWYDKMRLTYIAWGYIIAADSVWILGMIISLVCWEFYPTWEVLVFTWPLFILCGIIELIYQQYSLQGLFKMTWGKSFVIWGLSMLPYVLTNYILYTLLGSVIFA